MCHVASFRHSNIAYFRDRIKSYIPPPLAVHQSTDRGTVIIELPGASFATVSSLLSSNRTLLRLISAIHNGKFGRGTVATKPAHLVLLCWDVRDVPFRCAAAVFSPPPRSCVDGIVMLCALVVLSSDSLLFIAE